MSGNAQMLGRLEAFHAVLAIAAPGQPRFEELDLDTADAGQCEAALHAVHRRLGSAISKLSLIARENLRESVLQLSREAAQLAPSGKTADPQYRMSLEIAFRQIVGAMDMRASSSELLI